MKCLLLFAALAVRLRVEDLPQALRPGMERVLAEADARSEQRLREGEWDHCIYYVLQSARFTRLPHIEPALSAQEFAASKKTPAAVEARMDAFLKAAAPDDRGRYRMGNLSSGMVLGNPPSWIRRIPRCQKCTRAMDAPRRRAFLVS